MVQRLSGNFRKLLARVSVARSNQGALSDTESSAAYVLPAGLPPGPGVPPELNPVTPVDVPEAGLPPVPTEPPGLNPVTPVFEPAAGEVPDGTFADAAGAAGAGAGGGVDVVGAGGGGGGSAGAGAGANAAAAIVTAATARAAPPADAMVVLRMISTRFLMLLLSLVCCDAYAAPACGCGRFSDGVPAVLLVPLPFRLNRG